MHDPLLPLHELESIFKTNGGMAAEINHQVLPDVVKRVFFTKV